MNRKTVINKVYVVLRDQCDRKTSLFIQYLAILKIENLPNSKNIFQIRFKSLPIIECSRKRLPKIYNCLPNWWNFAKSGHTARDVSRGNTFCVMLLMTLNECQVLTYSAFDGRRKLVEYTNKTLPNPGKWSSREIEH